MNSQQPQFYAIRLAQQRTDHGDMWTAEHPDLLGCHVVCKHAQEAVDELSSVREEWLRRAKEQGRNIPQPLPFFRYDMILAPDASDDEATQAKQAIESASSLSVTP